MNEIQEKANDLLIEFDSICRENNIEYCLDPKTAGRAFVYERFIRSFASISVVMTVEDCLRFKDIVETSSMVDREIEYMGNSDRYNSFDFSYVDKSTTYIAVKRGNDFQKHGVRITIVPIRKNVKKRWLTLLETGWEKNGYSRATQFTVGNLMAIGIIKIMMIMGRKNLTKMLFSKLCTAYSGAKESDVFVRPFKTNRTYFEKGFFENKGVASLEENQYPVPKDLDTYLLDALGESWESKIKKPSRIESRLITMANVPYEKYLKNMEMRGLSLETIFNEERKNSWTRFLSRRYLRAQLDTWDLACRSGDRLEFYEEFSKKQELIQNLYDNEDFEALDEIFKIHEKKTKYYLSKGLGLCVSKEIFELQCELLLRRGEDEVVERLRKIVPAEHMVPIKTSSVK
ncbi:MAG: hypothetical protein RSA73_07985 [Anaerovoracaceae bacterium]